MKYIELAQLIVLLMILKNQFFADRYKYKIYFKPFCIVLVKFDYPRQDYVVVRTIFKLSLHK